MIRSLSSLFAFACAASLTTSAQAAPYRSHSPRTTPDTHIHTTTHAPAHQQWHRPAAKCHSPAGRPTASRHRHDKPAREARRAERRRAGLVALRHSDRNRDGYVTLSEALASSGRDFHRADRNQDGRLSRRELSRHQPAFARDRNRDGDVSYVEHQQATRLTFARRDTNRDGVLGYRELQSSKRRVFSPPRRPALYVSTRR